MKPQLTPEAFNTAPGLIPALSMREVKAILKEFHPYQRLKKQAPATGLELLNRAFYNYVMERLSQQGISSRALSIQIRESTKQRGALDGHTLRLERYARINREQDKPKRRGRHQGNQAMAPFIDALLAFYSQCTCRAPGLSRTMGGGDPGGPCVRFVADVMRAYAEKLPLALKQIDPRLSESLQLSRAAIFARIKDSSIYRPMNDPDVRFFLNQLNTTNNQSSN